MRNKTLLFTFVLAFVTSIGFAQKTINASDIMKDVKDGKSVNISNATIEGVLDFTFMDEKIQDLPRRRRWWNNGGSNVVKYTVESKVSFTNCTFKDDVLAYIPDEDSGYTFTANFDDDAIFKNCTFERKAMFKYSSFERNADFEGAKFDDDTTFKYAKFYNYVSFASSNFSETATFKYTKFKDGVSFNSANFEEDLNLKYTNVSGKFDIDNMKVAYDINSKYTKINGKSFTRYLLNRN